MELKLRELGCAFGSSNASSCGRPSADIRMDSHPLRDDESEQQTQHRHKYDQREQLAKLDTDVEREQRREQMGSRELECLAQGEREPEPVDEPKRKRDEPPALELPPTIFSNAM